MEFTEKRSVYARLPERICAWYAENKRILPWREEKDPYKIWVSEIMLQQTRVEAVKPYFARFLQELPDIGALAGCPEEKLLKLWEGLGYYSRVRNMQKAARQLVETAIRPVDTDQTAVWPVDTDKAISQSGAAVLPPDPKELQKLPGIGSYTAGAIASIAYGIPVPAVDGNVLRILARVTADDADILKASVKREAEQILTDVLQDAADAGAEKPAAELDPGDFNQGMMDLGAGVCVPNAQPLCEKCPLADICEAHRTGRETAYPVRKKARERRVEQRTILVIRDGERVALTRREDKGLLAGMYEFPNLSGRLNRKAVLQAVAEKNLVPLRIQKLEPAKHLFSHVEWQMSGYEIRVADFPESMAKTESSVKPDGDRAAWIPTQAGSPWFLAEIGQIEDTYPIPSAYKAYAQYLQMKIGMQGQPKTEAGMQGQSKTKAGMQEQPKTKASMQGEEA